MHLKLNTHDSMHVRSPLIKKKMQMLTEHWLKTTDVYYLIKKCIPMKTNPFSNVSLLNAYVEK